MSSAGFLFAFVTSGLTPEEIKQVTRAIFNYAARRHKVTQIAIEPTWQRSPEPSEQEALERLKAHAERGRKTWVVSKPDQDDLEDAERVATGVTSVTLMNGPVLIGGSSDGGDALDIVLWSQDDLSHLFESVSPPTAQRLKYDVLEL